METKYFKQKDFKDFDWSILKEGKYATNGENYSFGKGGINYPSGEGWFISIYSEDGDKEEVWALPEPINRFMEWQIKNAKEEKAIEIRRVLGTI